MARNERAAFTPAGTLSLHRKRRRPKDALLGALIVFCAALTVAVLVGLIGYILINGLPHVSWEFLTGTYSAREAVDPDAFNIAFATAAVLLILVFILNRLAGLLSRLLKKGG